MRHLLARRFGHLNLDRPCGSLDDLDIPSRQSRQRLRPWIPRLYLEILLRELLDAGAIALSMSHDRTDDSLRCVFVRNDWRDDPAHNWFEVVPAPGPLADGVLRELRRRAGCHEIGSRGVLPYRLKNTLCTATVMLVREELIGIWFTGYRPALVVPRPGESVELVETT